MINLNKPRSPVSGGLSLGEAKPHNGARLADGR